MFYRTILPWQENGLDDDYFFVSPITIQSVYMSVHLLNVSVSSGIKSCFDRVAVSKGLISVSLSIFRQVYKTIFHQTFHRCKLVSVHNV